MTWTKEQNARAGGEKPKNQIFYFGCNGAFTIYKKRAAALSNRPVVVPIPHSYCCLGNSRDMCPSIRTHLSCLLTLHVRYISRTTQQLDCDLSTSSTGFQGTTHTPHKEGPTQERLKFDCRPYLATTCHALKHVHRPEQATLSRSSVCTPTFTYPRQELGAP